MVVFLSENEEIEIEQNEKNEKEGLLIKFIWSGVSTYVDFVVAFPIEIF